MGSDVREPWQLIVEPDEVQKEILAPQSLEALQASLGVEPGQVLLARHPRHDRMYVVERLEQISTGQRVAVASAKKRIFISAQGVKNKAVVWYAGATVQQIERAIAKAANLEEGAIELRDGEDVVVLSTSLPNDLHLEVYPVARAKSGRGATASDGGQLRRVKTSPVGPVSAAAASAASQRLRREASPRRNASPPRNRPGNSSVGGSTTPTAHQSAPEEHCVYVLAGHTGSVLCLCGVGDILFTGSQDSSIMIWDLNNLQYIGTLPGHRGFVKCLHASYAKKVLCSGSQDRTVRVWSLDSFSTVKVLQGHTGGVNAVLILESTDLLVSGSEDRSIRVWDLTSFDALCVLEQSHLGGVFALASFGAAGTAAPSSVVSGARDRSLKVWDTSTWSVNRTLHPPHYDGVSSIAVCAKHGKFYSGSRDRSIKEWDMYSLTNTMHTLHVHGDWIQTLCMSPSEDVLFSGSKDGVVKVWDGELQCQDVLQGHKGSVTSLETVGHRLFSASTDRAVRVWRIEQYDEPDPFPPFRARHGASGAPAELPEQSQQQTVQRLPVASAALTLLRRCRYSGVPARRARRADRVAVRCAEGSTSCGDEFSELIESLQGCWEDDVGLSIQVKGNEVDFGDGTGRWRLSASVDPVPGALELRGTRWVGQKGSPEWQFPNGVRRSWTRPESISPEQERWKELFLDYKSQRQQLRRQLWSAEVAGESERAAALQALWDTGQVQSEEGLPEELEQQARLLAGRHLVPGTCFVHRRYGYRGVVLCCEPWCTAAKAWKRMMGVAKLPRGELQPFYHCLVDERDRPGGQVTFVGEENVGPDALAFPLEHPLVKLLLIRCEELNSYLPSPALETALSAQRKGDPFRLSLED
ncbi:Myosin heavy chain kinase B (MHCK-B) [Durusdinium trenchii]|uniref:Myosin heavy chain kinase B (MHCK-B) n=1 Tax=Durusdinium trenchii TaxID=1381693 RepID=A0ABP0SFX6_9DINO